MSQEKTPYINELSPEEKEILELAGRVRSRGHDPVKILKAYLDARETVEKVGKQTSGFLRKQWEAFKEGYDGN
ncbi:MAG: hypothetical protein GY749_31735 [Desulfobacteraceae bacterium]|nr:hypothetical protein [Desulfobacteraceae bacterium]MCP4352024.1 hypothetical protein [Desulfobacterales bacterium]